MWRLWIAIGAVIWVVTIGASASMNFLAGQALGRTIHEGMIFACIGLSADGWKALGPIFITAFFRERKFISGIIGMTVWLATAVFAISAAAGFVSQNRQGIVGNRASLQTTYEELASDLSRAEAGRSAIGTVSSAAEIEAEISALLAQPAAERGTVGSISSDCANDMRRTRNECATVANLRRDHARAVQASTLDKELASLRERLRELRERGASQEQDPQSALVSRLMSGWLSKADAAMTLVLLFVVMVELISAFAPVILTEYARVMRRDSQICEPINSNILPEADALNFVREYLLARLEPSDEGSISRFDMLVDFARWCRVSQRQCIDADMFIQKFERICREDFSEAVLISGEHYLGLRLAID